MARIIRIIALILAGEMVFALPFHTQRFFKATMLEAFDITNTQLGDMFAAFGVTAMLSYFLGGPFADRYSARTLLAVSLVSTAVAGLYMATFPGVLEMTALYAYWGISSTFLFWAALVKATRDWGGTNSQGMAFGILDGGRGFAAAAFAAIAVGILATYLPLEGEFLNNEDRRAGFRSVILYFSAITLLCGAIVWFLLPSEDGPPVERRNPYTNVPIVIRRPLIWAQAGVIICAYCGYKGLDNYSLYAVEVLGMTEVDAAMFATYGAYIRPVACVVAGFIADRFDSARSIAVTFAALIVSYSVLSFATLDTTTLTVMYANVFVTFFAVYALRGIYYALLEETKTPRHLTGASVAIIAFVGYTPEIFFGPVSGRILDANPGVVGHLNFFKFLMVVSVIGVMVTLWLIWLKRRRAVSIDSLQAQADTAV